MSGNIVKEEERAKALQLSVTKERQMIKLYKIFRKHFKSDYNWIARCIPTGSGFLFAGLLSVSILKNHPDLFGRSKKYMPYNFLFFILVISVKKGRTIFHLFYRTKSINKGIYQSRYFVQFTGR